MTDPMRSENNSVPDNDARDIAIAYVRRGWALLPIPIGEKAPHPKHWEQSLPTEADIPNYFNLGKSATSSQQACHPRQTERDHNDQAGPPTARITLAASSMSGVVGASTGTGAAGKPFSEDETCPSKEVPLRGN